MAASSDGTTVTTAQDKDGNTFAVRAVEGDSYALAYPVSDNGDGTVSLGAPVQRSMSDFDKGSMASAPLETYLQGLSARQRAQGQAEDAAAREQDMAASLPPIRADRPMQAVRPVTYFTTDMKKEKAAVEGSRIEAVADVPEGTAADAPVRVVVTAPNGKAEPGVMTYGQLQGMLADGSAMESGPVRRDPEHRVSVSGAAQEQQPLQNPQPSPQGTRESVAQAGTGTVSGQQPGEVNRPAQAQPAVQGQGGVAVEPSGTAAMPQGQAQPGEVSQGVEAAVPTAQAVQAAQPNVREDGMPLDEAGEPAYEQAPVQATWDDLMARNGRDEGKVRYFAQEMKAVKDRELKAERKRKPKGKNAAELQRAMDEQQAKIERLEQESSYWDSVLSMSYRAGEAAATEGARARQAEAGRKRKESERGFPAIQARWESARKEAGMTPEGRKARLEERHRQRQEAETEARERLAGLGAQDNGEPDYHRSGERGAEAPTEAEAELRDAIVGRLRASGIEVVTDSEAGQRVLDEVNGRRENRKRKSANDTGLPERDALSKGSVVPFADAAKIRENLETVKRKYENIQKVSGDSAISDLGSALGASRHGSSSQYVTIEAKNGNEVTIRLSDHNASVERMDNAGKDNAISIVISRKGNKGIQGTGKARMVEYYYSDKKLRQAGGKAVAAIARSLQQTLYSGEFKDTTGLADVDVKNADMKITGKVKFFRTPQGEAYGFTVGGKIYLDPRIAKADTPIHEYAHLWASALREGKPEEWANVAGLMKDTPVWEEVKKLYPELETDDEIADEVLATYSGRRGAERLREAMRGASGSGDLGKALSAVEAMGKVREALQRFWHAVADFLHIRYTTAEEVADRVLKDLLEGVKPGGESQRLRLQSKDEALFSGLTPEARAEMETIKAKAEADGTYMKAPNGKPTNLSERQWLQVRTKAFKEWFGDWEKKSMKDYLLHGKPVSGLTGNEFQKDGIPLTEKVGKFYQNEYGGKVTREGFGEVVLDERGVKDSLSHGIGRVKSAAFAAVPSIITDGRIVSTNENWKGRNYDSYTFAAPVKIGTETYVGVVVVTRGKGKNENRFYLHEVVLQKSLQDRSVKTGTEADSHHGDIAKVLKNIVSASDDVSKVVDENGEPLVVYHGTPLRRDQITPNRGWQRDGTYVRQKAPFHTFKGGEYSGMIFTSVEAAKARSIAEKQALSIPDNADGTEQWTEEGYVYDLFVNVKNPFVPQRDAEGIFSSMGANIPTLSFYGGEGESVPLDVAKEILESGNSWIVTETPQFIEKVRESGYDGLYGKDEGVDYIACFAPNQLNKEKTSVSWLCMSSVVACVWACCHGVPW